VRRSTWLMLIKSVDSCRRVVPMKSSDRIDAPRPTVLIKYIILLRYALGLAGLFTKIPKADVA
jgi:hypothetical protein